MTEGSTSVDPRKLWDEVVFRVKQGDVRLQLWEAMEHCIPIVVEENVLVLGIPTHEYHRAGQLTQHDVREEILRHLREITGRELDYTVFEGETQEQWEAYKERRRMAEEAAALQRKVALETAAKRKTWDALGQELQVKWGQLQDRSLPWVLARYLLEAFPLVAELEREAVNKPEDQHPMERRNLARILSRLATHTNLPVTLVALEYMRYKEREGLPSL